MYHSGLTWLPSLAATSAILSLLAWCWISAVLVAPPATPTTAYRKHYKNSSILYMYTIENFRWKWQRVYYAVYLWYAGYTDNVEKQRWKEGSQKLKKCRNIIQNISHQSVIIFTKDSSVKWTLKQCTSHTSTVWHCSLGQSWKRESIIYIGIITALVMWLWGGL